MAKLEIEGKKYKVSENLGYQGGHYAKAVETKSGEKIAVLRAGRWTWWTMQDRLCPPSRVVGMSDTEITVKRG